MRGEQHRARGAACVARCLDAVLQQAGAGRLTAPVAAQCLRSRSAGRRCTRSRARCSVDVCGTCLGRTRTRSANGQSCQLDVFEIAVPRAAKRHALASGSTRRSARSLSSTCHALDTCNTANKGVSVKACAICSVPSTFSSSSIMAQQMHIPQEQTSAGGAHVSQLCCSPVMQQPVE